MRSIIVPMCCGEKSF